jgi:hypothetical protein
MKIDPACVVKVGGGRGFIIEHRVTLHRTRSNWRQLVRFITRRLVVTAAHCLPRLPTAHANWDHTYENLLGGLADNRSTTWAECLFADPVADIAILGSPDNQQLEEQAEAYDGLTENAAVLRIGKAKSGPGWVLTLDNRWIPITLELIQGMWGKSLRIDPTEAGQSGSPILNHAGRAVGVVVIGSETIDKNGLRTNARAAPQAILTQTLPPWLS